MTSAVVALLASLALLGACQRASQQADAEPAPEDVRALFDVQGPATDALKVQLNTRFKTEGRHEVIEAGLAEEGFDCSADPTQPDERACMREVADGACTLISIVRSRPYTPQGAQVIKACPQGAPSPAP